MTVTRTTRQSWFQRLGGAFKGIIAGFLLLVIGLVGLFWNEGRAVATARALAEGAGLVISVPAERVDQTNEGKLIHLSGAVATDEALNDPAFAISVEAVRLIRKVEMFQWIENSRSERRTSTGGAEETVTTYSYARDWSSKPINSASFQERQGHENPPMTIEGRTVQIEAATLGAFTLNEAVLDRIGGTRPLEIDPARLDEVRMAYGGSMPVSLRDGRIHLGTDPQVPRIGDYRITFDHVPLGEISVVGKQAGDTLAPYQTRAGNRLLMVANGTVPADEMFANAQSANRTMTWALRLAGLVALYAAFILVLRPLAVAADVLPFLGRIVRAGTGIVAFAGAAALGSLVVALAWFAYRPLLATAVLCAGLLATSALMLLARRKASGRTADTLEPTADTGPGA
jgi:hypothetical protein